MRGLLRRGLRIILKQLTRAVLAKHKPKIIALVGESQTAIAREALYTVLHEHFPTRRSIEAPEAEFVIPLTIFGANTYPQSIFGWLKVLAKTAAQAIFFKPHFHILILEMTTGLTEILDYWLEITKPNILITCGKHPPSAYITEETAIRLPKVRNGYLKPYRKLALKIGLEFGVPEKEILDGLSKFSLPSPRIRILPGEAGNLIIDATYKYFPPSVKCLEEVLVPLSGNKLWIRSLKDWQEAKVEPKDVIVILGPRKELLEVVEEAALSPLVAPRKTFKV